MIDQYPSANGVLTSLIWRKTAAGGETSLSGYDNASQALSYTPGQEQVYLNGILLVRGSDYTATNGTSITGLAALAADDFVQINCYNNFSVATLPSTSITGEITNSQITSLATSKLTGTIANNQLANSAITINGSAISLGGSVSLPGDIESVTASTGLSGGGSSGAVSLSIDTAVTADLTTAQTLTNKTLSDPKINLAFDAETASYTAVLANNGQVVTMDNASANTFSIPTNASVAYPIGTQINVLQIGAGQTTIQAVTSGTTTILSTGATAAAPKIRARYGMATCIKASTDLWYVIGDIA